jgi:hypothetical protein
MAAHHEWAVVAGCMLMAGCMLAVACSRCECLSPGAGVYTSCGSCLSAAAIFVRSAPSCVLEATLVTTSVSVVDCAGALCHVCAGVHQ